MGRILLVVRLALRDLRRRRTEAALLLIAILAATTTLTLGLVVRDAASDPYQSTRAATKGPDVVAATGPFAGRADLEKLATAAGVTGHSGPYPVIAGKLEASGRTSDVQVVGRDTAIATVDQPERDAGQLGQRWRRGARGRLRQLARCARRRLGHARRHGRSRSSALQ